MIDFIRAAACHFERFGTIRVTSLMSYNNYFDPHNADFGSLLVFNDYKVPPAAGFKMHPHANCEQLFIVLEGIQKCLDTLDNVQILKPVTVQRVNAGNGYARESLNYGNSMLRYLSLRFQPRSSHEQPCQQMRSFAAAFMKDRLLKVASGKEGPSSGLPLAFDVNADAYLGILENRAMDHAIGEGGRSFIYLMKGQMRIGQLRLNAGDHLRVTGPETLRMIPEPSAWLAIIDMP